MKPARFKSRAYCNILILTGSIGSGHVRVAKAIADSIHRINGKGPGVHIVDLLTELSNIATKASKKIYLGSLKISPKLYELLFSHTSEKEWPMKLLNTVSIPFLRRKLFKLLRELRPSVLVSTFPIWDLLIGNVWKKYRIAVGKRAPFVSVITDSVSIHNAWTMGKPNFFLVANEDTKIALQNLGVSEDKIRVFGYPVGRCFLKESSAVDFQKTWNLSPKRRTLFLILSPIMRWEKVKRLTAAIKKSELKKLQLLIVTGTNERWKNRLEKTKWPWPTSITPWRQDIHTLIHGSDIILTKAGGATVMECIHSKKPMVIFEAIPGQEIGNAMLVQKYNLGVVLKEDLSDFDRAIKYILTHESLLKKNLLSQQKPHAAEDIARFLIDLAVP